MKRLLAILASSSLLFLLVPTTSFAAISRINGLTAGSQLLATTTTTATTTAHIKIVESGNDTHAFLWDGTPWRLDQGGTGTTTFTTGAIPFISGGIFAQDTTNLFWDSINKILTVGSALVRNLIVQGTLDIKGSFFSELINDTSGPSVAVDWKMGNVHTLTLTSSNASLSFVNGQAGAQYSLLLTQDSTGGRTVTWPSSVKWPGGIAPTLTSSAGSIDVVNFVYDGTQYLGTFQLNYQSQQAVPGISFVSATDCGAAASCSVTTSGSNPALVVFVHGDVSDNTPTCTYNGTPMTLVDKVGTPSDRWMYAFILLSPSTGTNTLACSGPSFVRILADSYSGVGQTSQPDNHATNSGSSVSSLSTSYNVNSGNSWIIQHTYAAGGAATGATVDGTPSTQRGNQLDGTKVFDSAGPVSAGARTVEWVNSNASNLSQIIVSLSPAN